MEIRFSGTMTEIVEQILNFMVSIKGVNFKAKEPDTLAQVPQDEPIKPVLTQAQMEENLANAPEHKEPPQPTMEQVRAALGGLRDRKGIAAVKELLKAYGAKTVQELKPDDYLGAIDRANTEV